MLVPFNKQRPNRDIQQLDTLDNEMINIINSKNLSLNQKIELYQEKLSKFVDKNKYLEIEQQLRPQFQTNDLIFTKSVESAISLTSKDMKKDVWIAGGEKVYKEGLKVADFLYITKINTEVEKADSRFPSFDIRDWTLHNKSAFYKSDRNNSYDYCFLIYSKK